MKIRYALRNYIAILVMQWVILISGLYVLFGLNHELSGYGWLVIFAFLIPPIYTVFLYNRWGMEFDEGCIKLAGPLKKNREELCVKDMSEIVVRNYSGRKGVKSITDRESHVYQLGNLLSREDCIRLWKEISEIIGNRSLKVDIIEE